MNLTNYNIRDIGLLCVLFLMSLLFISHIFFSPGLYFQYRLVNNQIIKLQSIIDRQSRINADLEHAIDAFSYPDMTVEHQARESLGMIKDGEVFYQWG